MILNPDAQPFGKEECADARCLFLTFSNGFPLSEGQIFGFFNWMYPRCVEDVYVHRPTAGRPSLFGKVTFNNPMIPIRVMGNREKVSFNVDGLPLICRRFVTKKSTDAATTSNSLGGAE